MCFNKESSIIVFILGLACSIKLLMTAPDIHKSKIYVCALFLFVISLMQLVEYFIWLYQPIYADCKKWINDDMTFTDKEVNPPENIIAGYFLISVLFFQICSMYLACAYFDLFYRGLFYIFTLIFIAFSAEFVYAIDLMAKADQTKLISIPKQDCDSNMGICRLSWGPIRFFFNEHYAFSVSFSVIYMILLAILAYTIFSWSGVIVLVSTIVIAILSVYLAQNPVESTYGSIWCFSVLVFCIIGVIFEYIKNFKFRKYKVYNKIDRVFKKII